MIGEIVVDLIVYEPREVRRIPCPLLEEHAAPVVLDERLPPNEAALAARNGRVLVRIVNVRPR